MSLYGALLTGISGLQAQSQALSVTSSNIANVNTVGYKTTDADFATVLTSELGVNDSQAGVTETTQQHVLQQGQLQTAASPTDLAITGNGFFVTTTTPNVTGGPQYYTRAGNFSADANGNLVNASGYYLLAYPVTTSGLTTTTSTTLQPINISNLSGKAAASTTLSLQANLQSGSTVDSSYTTGDMANGNATPDFQRTINVYDSQGNSQPLDFSFIKTGANTWSYEVSYAGSSANITASNPIATGTMSFNADGTLANADTSASPATGQISFTIPWSASSGLSPQALNVNMGKVGSSDGLSQFDSPSTLTSSKTDGALYGSLSGVTVNADGYVTANYSNGLSQQIYQVPLATFADADGLVPVSGTAYTQSLASGPASVNVPNANGSGSIASSQLEASTVDINKEFSSLITTQNAYSAAARIISTADQMYQTLNQIQPA
jgi:flagellar hook protein FlgE